jgi:hypothetical protein
MSESDMRDRKKTPDVAGAHPGYATVSTKRKSEIFFAARLDTSGKSVPPQIVGRIRYVARMSECDMRERKKPRMSLALIRATANDHRARCSTMILGVCCIWNLATAGSLASKHLKVTP